MKTLKKDVIRELKKNKEDKINPIVLVDIKETKTEKQIAMVLLQYYMVDIMAKCFEPSDLSKYWKEWAIKDYLKTVKKVKNFDSDSFETKIEQSLDSQMFNLFDLDLAIRDMFDETDIFPEKFQEMLDSREALHVRMINLVYETLKTKSEYLQNQLDKINRFMKA